MEPRHKNLLIRKYRNPSFIVGSSMLLFCGFAAIFGPFLNVDPYSQTLHMRLSGPSYESPFGRDELGRDVFSRIIIGTRYSLGMAFGAVILSMTLGTIIGLLSGYYRGWIDSLTMRLIDLMLAFPTLLLGLAIISVFGAGLSKLTLSLGIAFIPSYARLIRSSVLSLREEEFVLSAISIGSSSSRIMFIHILPNALSPLLVQTTYGLALALVLGSGLSFLGLGAQPPTPEWGVMLSRGREYLHLAPHLSVIPGLAIAFVTLGMNLLGDGLRDILDPKLHKWV